MKYKNQHKEKRRKYFGYCFKLVLPKTKTEIKEGTNKIGTNLIKRVKFSQIIIIYSTNCLIMLIKQLIKYIYKKAQRKIKHRN